ncbi:hypothetical protein Tco_0169790 [Tanacetum coccineum]
MATRGRKKAVAEPVAPARDPRDVETIKRLQQRIQSKTRRQKKRKLSPMSGMMGQRTAIILAEETLGIVMMQTPFMTQTRFMIPMLLDEPDDELVYLDRGKALVIHRVLNVAVRGFFSIGKNYKDEVRCEVIPMDAAHILSGLPWQFDRKTKHDGFQNTYSFKKDEENEIISEAPLQVQPLLKEFADVIPDDIPPGLPAITDI